MIKLIMWKRIVRTVLTWTEVSSGGTIRIKLGMESVPSSGQFECGTRILRGITGGTPVPLSQTDPLPSTGSGSDRGRVSNNLKICLGNPVAIASGTDFITPIFAALSRMLNSKLTMTGNEIREKFLEYFERQGHTRVRSSPLLPANDPTLLFTNAGMNQFKDVFLGAEKRDYLRACSSQKCVRAGGKHNDLDEVGKTARHQTFFEMLGNFSFGDYFKEDAIKFAWDLLVNEYKLDPARMWFSVFEGDDEVGPDEEAEKCWEQVGAPRERILRFGRKDNFWQMGETGPCGPCSEVHYYMGDDPSDAENCVANVNGPGDTITEIWNLVFMQFERTEVEGSSPTVREGEKQFKLTPLPAPSVDTGMGLERLAVVLQGVKSNYETDLLKPIIDFTADLAAGK